MMMDFEHEQWLRLRLRMFSDAMDRHVLRVREFRFTQRSPERENRSRHGQWYVFVEGSGHGNDPGLRAIPDPPIWCVRW